MSGFESERTQAFREGFRQELRARFVSGALDERDSASQEARSSRTGGSMDAERKCLPDPGVCEPAPAFRSELRDAFVAGFPALESDAPDRRAAADAAGTLVPVRRSSARGRHRPEPEPRSKARFALVGAGLALAAGLAAVVGLQVGWFGFGHGGPELQSWTAQVASDLSSLELDGSRLAGTVGELGDFRSKETVDAEGRLGLERALAQAETLSFGESSIELALEEEGIYVAALPGTVLNSNPFRDREAGGRLDLDLAAGELFVTTREGSGPHDIRIRTAEAEVRVVGTTLGVMRAEGQTCVCVAEGAVEVAPLDGAAQPATELVTAGRSFVMMREPDELRRLRIDQERDVATLPNPEHFQHHVDELGHFFVAGTRAR